MKPDNIHHLNTVLILVSCGIAFIIPFELFLFSYAVLGPLHYLTEIGWLHKKNYFTKGRNDFWILVASCLLLMFFYFNPPKDITISSNIILFGLVVSIVLVVIKDWLYRLAMVAVCCLVIALANDAPGYNVWMLVFLPSVIHVFVFTWMFMLYGVLKEKSLAGTISVFVFFACAVTLITFQPQGLAYVVGDYSRKAYANFVPLSMELVKLLNLGYFADVSQAFTTNAGFVVMRFIAFAYTYHYLNWFSKTSVIKWHQVPKQSLVFTLVLWLLSLAVYAYDYVLGTRVLIVLSFLHVFLEFPLNVISFIGVGKAIGQLGRGKMTGKTSV